VPNRFLHRDYVRQAGGAGTPSRTVIGEKPAPL